MKLPQILCFFLVICSMAAAQIIQQNGYRIYRQAPRTHYRQGPRTPRGLLGDNKDLGLGALINSITGGFSGGNTVYNAPAPSTAPAPAPSPAPAPAPAPTPAPIPYTAPTPITSQGGYSNNGALGNGGGLISSTSSSGGFSSSSISSSSTGNVNGYTVPSPSPGGFSQGNNGGGVASGSVSFSNNEGSSGGYSISGPSTGGFSHGNSGGGLISGSVDVSNSISVSSPSGPITSNTLPSSNNGAYSTPASGPVTCGNGEVLNVGGICVRPRVSRNIFVYSAPPMPPQSYGPPPEIPRPKIDYNIVFVKTPAGNGGPEPIIVPPPQKKTLVYVLSKKDTSGPKIIEVPAGPDSQPQVYYIHYKEGDNPTLPGGVDLQSALVSAPQTAQIIGSTSTGSNLGGSPADTLGGSFTGGDNSIGNGQGVPLPNIQGNGVSVGVPLPNIQGNGVSFGFGNDGGLGVPLPSIQGVYSTPI